MPQFRDIPVAPDAKHVRVQLAEADVVAIARVGAEELVSVAAVARVALSLFASGAKVDAASVLKEIRRIRADRPKAEPKERRKRGRPRKRKESQ